MKTFENKVAVITGAASGIGLAMVNKCIQEGMKVVLADIDATRLLDIALDLQDKGATVLAVVTDVSKEEDIINLANKTIDTFAAVHLLFNNAGVIVQNSYIWESTAAEWDWNLKVNMLSVVNGIRVFVPIMLKQDCEGVIINTASEAGFTSHPNMSMYKVAKYGVVTLSETLYHELNQKSDKVKAVVVCPGIVNTRLMDSTPPTYLKEDIHAKTMDDGEMSRYQKQCKALLNGMPPHCIPDDIFKAIRENKFYVFTHPGWQDRIQTRINDILEKKNPTNCLAGTGLTL